MKIWYEVNFVSIDSVYECYLVIVPAAENEVEAIDLAVIALSDIVSNVLEYKVHSCQKHTDVKVFFTGQ